MRLIEDVEKGDLVTSKVVIIDGQHIHAQPGTVGIVLEKDLNEHWNPLVRWHGGTVCNVPCKYLEYVQDTAVWEI